MLLQRLCHPPNHLVRKDVVLRCGNMNVGKTELARDGLSLVRAELAALLAIRPIVDHSAKALSGRSLDVVAIKRARDSKGISDLNKLSHGVPPCGASLICNKYGVLGA